MPDSVSPATTVYLSAIVCTGGSVADVGAGVGGGAVGAYVACVGGAVGGASVVGAVLGTNAVIVGSVVVLDVEVSSEPGPTRSGLSMLRSVPHAARTTTARSAVAILLT